MNVGVIMYQTSYSKGQELVAQRMVAQLNRQGHRAYLITSRFHDFLPVVPEDEIKRSGGFVSGEDERLGVTVFRVDSHLVEWPPRRIDFNNFTSTLERLVEELDLDVLITHSTLWNGPDLTAQFVSWKRSLNMDEPKERRLIFCHMSHFQPPASGRYSVRERTFRRSWNEYSLKRIIREADLLLVATPLAERAMVELGARRDQCLLFPGGIEIPPPRSQMDLEDFRRAHDLPADAKLVTFLGTVEERKNVLAILRIAEAVRDRTDIRFVVAGRLEGAYASRVLSEGRRLSNLSILGEISDGDKASLIRTSYLNVTMTRLEALGLVQLEFMSAGVPVISSGVGGQSWIVHGGTTGVVLAGPDDIEGAVEGVVELSDDGRKRDQMGRNARRFAKGLSIDHLVKRLISRLLDIQASADGGALRRSGSRVDERPDPHSGKGRTDGGS
jgi:glycosyltransferase involved in cell wall biosynthesis